MKPYYIFFLAICIFLSFLDCLFGQKSWASNTDRVYLEARLKKCSAELYINSIPVKKTNKPFLSIPVQEYVIDGVNKLELIIEPGKSPSQARTSNYSKQVPQGMEAGIRLVRYPVGTFTEDENAQILVEKNWKGETGKRTQFPIVLSVNVDLKQRLGRWAWQDAQKLELNDALMKKILPVVQTVHEAFAQGKGEPIVKLCHVFSEEVAKAYPGQSVEEGDLEFINMLKEYRNDADWIIEPLDKTQFDFRLCADNRLVQIIDKNWLPTVRTKPMKDGDPISFHMFLGIFNGKIQILR